MRSRSCRQLPGENEHQRRIPGAAEKARTGGQVTTLRVHLRFPPEIIKRPVIHEIGHTFNIITNIRRANITLEEGWADIEISGDSKEIDKAVDTLRSWGVRVDPIEGDVIE